MQQPCSGLKYLTHRKSLSFPLESNNCFEVHGSDTAIKVQKEVISSKLNVLSNYLLKKISGLKKK